MINVMANSSLLFLKTTALMHILLPQWRTNSHLFTTSWKSDNHLLGSQHQLHYTLLLLLDYLILGLRLNILLVWQFEPENVLKMLLSFLLLVIDSISLNQCAHETRNLSKNIICYNVVSSYL